MLKNKILLTLISLILLIVSSMVYFLFFTTKGSGFITKFALSNYVSSKNITVKEIEGKFSEQLSYHNIEIKDLKGLPQGSILKIQKLDVFFSDITLEGLNIKIYNGRFKMPGSDTILFYGTYTQGSLALTAYSNHVNISEILDLFTESRALSNISGQIYDLDVQAQGTFLQPQLEGTFYIKKLSRSGFTMIDSPGKFSLRLTDIKDKLKLNGEVVFKSAKVFGKKTAVIELNSSKILFSGDPKNPFFDMRGHSDVDDVKIDISLKGQIHKPDLKLISQPQAPEQKLIIMLATGKSWQAADASLDQNKLSPELAGDFVDYFIFGGSRKRLAKKLGLSDVSLQFDDKIMGVGLKKEVFEKASLTYEIEQSKEQTDNLDITQKIGGSYKITDHISVEGEKELRPDTQLKAQEDEKTDDKILLKYKRKF